MGGSRACRRAARLALAAVLAVGCNCGQPTRFDFDAADGAASNCFTDTSADIPVGTDGGGDAFFDLLGSSSAGPINRCATTPKLTLNGDRIDNLRPIMVGGTFTVSTTFEVATFGSGFPIYESDTFPRLEFIDIGGTPHLRFDPDPRNLAAPCPIGIPENTKVSFVAVCENWVCDSFLNGVKVQACSGAGLTFLNGHVSGFNAFGAGTFRLGNNGNIFGQGRIFSLAFEKGAVAPPPGVTLAPTDAPTPAPTRSPFVNPNAGIVNNPGVRNENGELVAIFDPEQGGCVNFVQDEANGQKFFSFDGSPNNVKCTEVDDLDQILGSGRFTITTVFQVDVVGLGFPIFDGLNYPQLQISADGRTLGLDQTNLQVCQIPARSGNVYVMKIVCAEFECQTFFDDNRLADCDQTFSNVVDVFDAGEMTVGNRNNNLFANGRIFSILFEGDGPPPEEDNNALTFIIVGSLLGVFGAMGAVFVVGNRRARRASGSQDMGAVNPNDKLEVESHMTPPFGGFGSDPFNNNNNNNNGFGGLGYGGQQMGFDTRGPQVQGRYIDV